MPEFTVQFRSTCVAYAVIVNAGDVEEAAIIAVDIEYDKLLWKPDHDPEIIEIKEKEIDA